MLDKQLLDRFLKNECSPDERRMVIDYLASHPDEAARLLPAEEFEEVRPVDWDTQRSERSFHQIQSRLGHRTTQIGRRTTPIVRWSLVAAAVLLAIVGVKWLFNGTGKPTLVAKAEPKAEDVWITEANDSTHSRMFLLPDGSSAELSPRSRISYRRSFGSDDQRIIKLTGEGQFNVTGDPKRPFMVVSDELTTTVLGTWFAVTADSGASIIKVHLYSGKVRVGQSAGKKWKTTDSSLLLAPGEELVYNRQQMLAVIRRPAHLGNKTLATTTRPHQQTASAKPQWYMFGGQSLADVFGQLSDYYGVQINFFPTDVENRYFTGKFSRTESLDDILSDIALLHGLTLTKKEGMYVFRKKDR